MRSQPGNEFESDTSDEERHTYQYDLCKNLPCYKFVNIPEKESEQLTQTTQSHSHLRRSTIEFCPDKCRESVETQI